MGVGWGVQENETFLSDLGFCSPPILWVLLEACPVHGRYGADSACKHDLQDIGFFLILVSHTNVVGEFPGCPVVRSPCFHCNGPGFNPWSGNKDPASHGIWSKKEEKKCSCQRTKLQDCYLSAFLCSMAMECTPYFSHCLPILLKAEWVGELAWCRSIVYFLESLEIEMPSGPLMTRVERTLSTSGEQSQGLCHIKENTLIIMNACCL